MDYEQEIRALLSGLKRVEAPKDFELRVKARIAQGRRSSMRHSLPQPETIWVVTATPRLAYALPLLLVVLAGTFFFFRSADVAENNQSASVITSEQMNSTINPVAASPEMAPVGPVATAPGSDKMAQVNPVATAHGSDKMAQVNPVATAPGSDKKQVRAVNRSGGSFDIGSTESDTLFPKGFDPRKATNVKPEEFKKAADASVDEILGLLGIKTEVVEAKYRVRFVGENSVAERSGVKVGDFIEAVNERSVSGKFQGPFQVTSLTVRRDGASIRIAIK